MKVGGNFVSLSPAGVMISGTMVMINSGGAAGSGAGCSPTAPTDAKEADDAKAGEATKQKQAPPPPKPPNYSALASGMAGASKKGTPFVSK